MSPANRVLLMICLSAVAMSWHAVPVEARAFRPALMPNGSANSCLNCHFNPFGGGSRNPFGEAVRSLVTPNGREEFWSPTLAAQDSDGDGFTNGQELGDADGDGVRNRTRNISLPGDLASFPEAAPGDCNLDLVLDTKDLACVASIDERDAVLGALNTLPGDVDGDGQVAFADFLILSNNFNKDLPAYTDGNLDLAGSVDFADFLVLSTNFGKTAAGAASSVPEPNGGLLGLIGLFGVLWRRRSSCALGRP